MPLAQRVHGANEDVQKKLDEAEERYSKLQAVLERNPSFAESPQHRAARLKDGKGCCARVFGSTLLGVFRRSLNGLVTTWLYFADVISDVEVTLMLHAAGFGGYALIAATLLVLQFLVVWLRVLPYLRMTFGPESRIYCFFLFLGFPFGMVGLDCLMFLEPFGLLPVVPISNSMRQFIPAYKATRIIAEVLIESLPQCLLQSYILVTVMHHVNAGHASSSEMTLLDGEIDGDTFAHILPRSIAISTITTLKAWIELVHSAREAGISVRTKAVQLLHVGFGLPLDALKKGTILEWSCTYHLADGEVPPLLDALVKNSSLTRLNLAAAGLEWTGPEASKERGATSLVDAMASSPAVLEQLQRLVISATSGYEIPVAALRRGGEEALAALREVKLLAGGGPRRLEILLMADLLRTNRRKTAVAARDVEESASAVVALIEAAKRGELGRDEWEGALTKLIVAGDTRRAHLKSLVGAAMLCQVGFEAAGLLAADFSPEELKDGGFSAKSLREADPRRFAPAALRDLGYQPAELKQAGFSAADLRLLGFSAAALRDAAFDAAQLRAAAYALTELKAAGFSVPELKDALYSASELRAADFEAEELRKAKFMAIELREAGFTAAEMKDGGFALKRVLEAGYDATDATALGLRWQVLLSSEVPKATGVKEHVHAGLSAALASAAQLSSETAGTLELAPSLLERLGVRTGLRGLRPDGYVRVDAERYAQTLVAGWSLEQLKAAGTEARALREAGYAASELRAVGFELEALKIAGYDAADLQAAGFDAAALKESGTSLFQLKQANTPIATLKEAGYKADRLKQQGYTASELARGGYNAKELRGFRDQLYHDESTAFGGVYAGFTAKELRDGKVPFGAAELRQAGYSESELREGGYTAAELRAKGASAADLRCGGYSCKELHDGGYAVELLREVGYTAGEARHAGLGADALRRAGFTVHELRKAGVSARDLQAAGCSVGELREGGFGAAELTAVGIGIGELKRVGVGVAELRAIGCKVKVLASAAIGFTQAELQHGGFDSRALAAVGGASAESLRASGYDADEMRRIGWSASELRAGGYTCKQLKEGGFAAAELVAGGFKRRSVEAVDGRPAMALRSKGYPAKELRALGFSAQEMVDGAYPAKELKEIGFSCDELKAAGSPAAALREAGYASKQLKAAGFTLRELREGGFPWKDLVIFLRSTHAELVDAGFEGLDPKDRIFREYRPE